jgi:hypothetical protein
MDEELRDIWRAIDEDRKELNFLRVSQAGNEELLRAIKESVDEIKRSQREELQRLREIDEKNGAQDLQLANLKKDVDALGSKLRNHLREHRWWAVFVLSVAGLAVAVVKLWR